ncbi:hypothetical protein NHQ30_011659 [Ciborinia camelliae]|nr:hypothetical protein NHQ30_011659 [Ciborinia camelliae]
MVKFSSIALFIIASVVSVQAACTYCQCKFRGGQDCCVTPTQTSTDNNIDCRAACADARRDDGTEWVEGQVTDHGTRCNGGGNFQCVNQLQMEMRVKCVDAIKTVSLPGPSPMPK